MIPTVVYFKFNCTKSLTVFGRLSWPVNIQRLFPALGWNSWDGIELVKSRLELRSFVRALCDIGCEKDFR